MSRQAGQGENRDRDRRVWKAEGPTWQLWAFGLIAAAGLLTLGFVPMDPSG